MAELTQVLRHVLPVEDPNVLVGHTTGDDAAVYRLSEDRALVVTADFFTPIVDDPYDFGRIAAANALSDIYAMGGRPLFVLNLVGFPRRLLPEGLLEEILRGGSDMTRAAGVPTIGGHSIDDDEPGTVAGQNVDTVKVSDRVTEWRYVTLFLHRRRLSRLLRQLPVHGGSFSNLPCGTCDTPRVKPQR